MHTLLRVALLCALLQVSVVYTQCVRDSYSSLPPLPTFPSATYTGTMGAASTYVQNHWSEVAKLPRPANTIVSTQTDCPHLGTGLLDWHAPATWGGSVPQNGADVEIPANSKVLISSCSFPATHVFGLIHIPAGSTLILGDAQIALQATGMHVEGSLLIGSPTCRLRNKITITMHGQRPASVPAIEYVKGIYVTGVIDVHGVEFFPTWTRLSATAKTGDKTVFIQDCPNWQPGQSVVITTTELKDSRDWHRNEELIIDKVEKTSITNVCAVSFTTPLLWNHYGGFEYQAEVGLLTRNILIQGDAVNSEPTDISPLSCNYGTSPSTYPCEDSFLTGWGVHVMVATGATTGRFSGVEVYRGGQTNALGRYPLHFHMIGNLTTPGMFFVTDASVHRSYFRCYTIHGTSGTTLDNGITITKSTGYDVIGHCFFASEDGVEENHILSYNLAAHIHPLGPFWQPSEGITQGAFSTGSQSFGSQGTATITSNPKLVLADDISGSPFYFTNAYSKIIGNAASGGWAGFAFPNLPAPKGFFKSVTNFVPKNRPTLLFQGNSAHSTGFWQGHAAGVYLGGNLKVDPTTGDTIYTSGRFLPARDTCSDSTAGSAANTKSCPADKLVWNQFYDTKVFLANVGLQSWGDRSELVRFEVHDVQLSTNVFGEVWIDQMLVNCRSKNVPTYLSGCTNPTQWWLCNVRDQGYFRGFGGFQFYDTGQSHIVTNSKFSNCQSTNPNCIGGKCSIAIFQYLTHSDQFTPALMQCTRNITYDNVDKAFVAVPSTKASKQITVSGRDASWLDEDGSITGDFPGEKVNLGSNWAGPDWWRFNSRCINSTDSWVCPMSPGDSLASLFVHWDQTKEQGIGSTYCSNGAVGSPSAYLPCPIGAQITHFGRDEANAFNVAVMPRVTGPIIAESGGWFIRYLGGTPNLVTIDSIQVDHDDMLQIAIPYPAGTTFEVWAQAPYWCTAPAPPVQSWYPVCRHDFRSVNSVAELRAAWGDAYYYDSARQHLHVRIVAFDSFGYKFASEGTKADSLIWGPNSTSSSYFARGGSRLLHHGSQFWSINIKVTSSNCNPACPLTPGILVPPAMPFVVSSTPCSTLPTIANAAAGNCVAGAASGTICTPVCMAGYTGTLSSKCNSGSWSNSGSCTPVCTTLPTIANGNAGNCMTGVVSGTTCTPQCSAGYSGTLSAQCSATGTWTVTGSCTQSGCASLPTLSNIIAGDCKLPVAFGTSCTPLCDAGTQGTISATCNAGGTWTTTGTCTSTYCNALPVVPFGTAGDCKAPSLQNTVCTPACNAGYSGTVKATCTSAVWTITGSCATTACGALPAIQFASVGDCKNPSPSGTVCTPACNSGYQGTVSATCSNGSWSISGFCTSTACTSLPTFKDGSAGDCQNPTASGVSCTPQCNTGFSGTLVAKCDNGGWLTSGSCTTTACTTAPALVNADVNDCKTPSASGTTCTPLCTSGFSGTLSAKCDNTAWNVTGTCTSTACPSLPFIANADNGDCVLNTPSGTSCSPVCKTGFVASATLKATCTDATWTTFGNCLAVCAGLPTITDSLVGDCKSDVASGYSCVPVCKPGFTGPLTASCTSGSWSTTGTCKGNPCAGLPVIPDATAGNCTADAAHGTKCVPTCSTGFAGTLSALCDAGKWTTSGTCALVGGQPCTTLPSLVANSVIGDCKAPSTSGTACKPVCDTGYTGTLTATCSSGNWQLTGTCTSTACAATPVITDANAGDCKSNTPSGSTCVPLCNTGFAGTLSAKCDNTVWNTTGSCTSTSCASLPVVANANAGTCSTNAASGTTCKPACDSGFQGDLTSACENGAWTTTGSCNSTSCQSLPPVLNAGAGDCQVGQISGTTCVPVCNTGFSGQLKASCTAGAWNITGTCSSTACPALPNIVDGTPGNCLAGSPSGTLCKPTCNAGFLGPVSAECAGGAWSISGRCVSVPCTGVPSVQNGAAGDCVAADSGAVCTPVCNTGFAGTLSAKCNQGVWTVSGICATTAGPSCTVLPVVEHATVTACTANVPSGTTCVPQCETGYSGSILATCSSGSWSVSGSCKSTACSVLPTFSVLNAVAGDCAVGTASGVTCTPQCAVGFTGTLSAKCENSAWTVTGGCSAALVCKDIPATEGVDAGSCAPGSADGTTCKLSCVPGWTGDASAVCVGTWWKVVSNCISTACGSLPAITGASPGNCVVPTLSDTSCTPVCNSGLVGNLVATCSRNTWAIRGSCGEPQPAPVPSPQPGPEPKPVKKHWYIEVKVEVKVPCAGLEDIITDLNKWLNDHYSSLNVDVHLVMQRKDCTDMGSKRQDQWSSVTMDGILYGPDAEAVAPDARPTIEQYFLQSSTPSQNLEVSSSVVDEEDSGLPVGAIVGIIVGVLAALIILAVIFVVVSKNKSSSGRTEYV